MQGRFTKVLRLSCLWASKRIYYYICMIRNYRGRTGRRTKWTTCSTIVKFQSDKLCEFRCPNTSYGGIHSRIKTSAPGEYIDLTTDCFVRNSWSETNKKIRKIMHAKPVLEIIIFFNEYCTHWFQVERVHFKSKEYTSMFFKFQWVSHGGSYHFCI